jgi:short-subunit dehydrogenase
MTQTPPLAQQVILITGASTGIGATLARCLASQYFGISLVLAARNQEKLEAVKLDCLKAGADVLVVPTDLAVLEQVQALAQTALQHFSRVDVLVNNAGYGQMGPIELITPEDAQRQFAVNFHAPLVLTQAFIPTMRDQGHGRIINISSLGGRVAFPAGGMYSSSKFALEALSDVMRMELGAFNIKVSVIEPGPVTTGFFNVAGERVDLNISESGRKLYHPAIQAIKEIEQQTAAMVWSSERVARVIIKAMNARNPRPRYVAATGGKTMLFLMTKLLPREFVDFFWKHYYKIDQVEKAWKSRNTFVK